MITAHDGISLLGDFPLLNVPKVKFQVRVNAPEANPDIVQQAKMIATQALQMIAGSLVEPALPDEDAQPLLTLFVNAIAATDCVSNIPHWIYRVELVLRENVKLVRAPNTDIMADTWRCKSAVGYVPQASGLQALQGAVLVEITRQVTLFANAMQNASVRNLIRTFSMPTQQALDDSVGKHIRQVCGNNFASDDDNHCAHYISHMINLQTDYTCRDIAGGNAAPASIRVQEVFSRCTQVGTWANLPAPLNWGLIFITNVTNVNIATKTMANVPRKHVGIFFGGTRTVYQYKNALRQVVRQTPTEFGQHYAAPDNALFFGSMS